MAARRKRPNNPVGGAVSAPRLWGARLLIGVALGVSGYLAYVSLTQGTVAGCGPESGCSTVLQSRWGRWFGLPVSLFALGVDTAILGASFRLGPGAPPALQRRAWGWITPLAMLVAGAAIWFVALQLLVVRAICPYCMVAHLCGLGAAILLLITAGRGSGGASERERPDLLPPSQFRRAWALAGVGFAMLVLGQAVPPPPKTFAVTPMEKFTNDFRAATKASRTALSNSATALKGSQVNTGSEGMAFNMVSNSTKVEPAKAVASSAVPSAMAPAGSTAAPPILAKSKGARRLFPVYGGRFQVDLFQVPALGAWTNPHAMAILFDYTCHHCRAMHPLLVELQRTFSNQLVIACLPMPLEPGCNWTVTRHSSQHTNACEYARLGLGLWRVNAAKFRIYEDWVMEGEESPPPLELARQKAIDLVGEAALQQAVRDPWVEQQLRQDVAIYEVAYQQRQGQMPQMIIGPNIAVGSYPREELFKIVESTFGLKAGP
ncbi:MAG TPA: vitamin K epoxide reductase family protein [Verrucomicrobiae bacterium]|nr:vitamin K epoxide reductase family protein [Verrucomicrobiae bacterium]